MAEALSAGAAATLRALLIGDDPVRAALRAQIAHTRVSSRCGCGCVTVDLAVDRTAAKAAPVTENPAVEAGYSVPEDAGVMVFTQDGYLSLLELYSTSGEPVTVWPEHGALQL
ncbi:hypothetical protein [Streptomyces albipurpureus]|uniref:Uncharacterized protein n=1 Tax=Streptomyces albipurpureus TaxID=2897419 RepID=A0ABT0UMH3_9ACTN|nr:hypothetical protein [Streptomyces sp. CWNU-1]MCM2389270.1 hypothetical protein [Streptomyces sp. CWNU-1]